MSIVKRSFPLFLACVLIAASVGFPMVARAYPETTLPYRIHVSRSKQIVTVWSTETNEIVRQMICSTGLAGTPTITGTFKLPKARSDERKNWYVFSSSGGVLAHYATRITGSYLFHSILYYRAAASALDRKSWSMLGKRASHGCVRMTPLDAQWIAYNCAPGTIVTINDRGTNGPITTSSQIKRTLPNPAANGTLPGWEATLKPTPRPDQAATRPTLNVGIQGPLTKSMQGTLRSLGYYGGKVNGKFGESTKTALEAFQAAYLKQNPGTSEEASVNGLGTPVWQDRVKASKTNTALTGTRRTLKLNAVGLSVKVLRTRLKELGYTTKSAKTKYDANTRGAVKLFQLANGLKANGIANKDVQDALFGSAQKPLPYARVNVKGGVSLRRAARSNGAVLARLKQDYRLRVLKPGDEWTMVATASKWGYVRNDQITLETAS